MERKILNFNWRDGVSNKELRRIVNTESSWSEMEVGRWCGKTTPKSMGADSNNVGSIRRKEDKGKTDDEMGGPPMVTRRKKQRKMEI